MTNVREKVEEIIDDLESNYDSQGSANYDGRYTDKLLSTIREELLKEMPRRKGSKNNVYHFDDLHVMTQQNIHGYNRALSEAKEIINKVLR